MTEKSETALATKLDQIIFTDFFGYFLIFLVFSKGDQSVSWKWPLSVEEGFRIVGYLVIILVAGWFIEGIAGWTLTVFWMAGLVMSLSDIPSLKIGALLRIGWALLSAFLVALVASFAGVAEEQLLQDHVPTLFAWGLLYFGGVAFYRIVRVFAFPST